MPTLKDSPFMIKTAPRHTQIHLRLSIAMPFNLFFRLMMLRGGNVAFSSFVVVQCLSFVSDSPRLKCHDLQETILSEYSLVNHTRDHSPAAPSHGPQQQTSFDAFHSSISSSFDLASHSALPIEVPFGHCSLPTST